MCLGLIFSAVHHGMFFNILKTDLKKPLPKTLDEILQTNFTKKIVICDSIVKHMLSFIQKAKHFEYTVKRKGELLTEVLDGKERLGLCSGMMIVFSGRKQSSFHVLSERYSMVLNTIYFTKNSFLLQGYNKMILELYSGGILQKWHTDIYRNVEKNDNQKDSFKALGIHELRGIFQISFICLTFTCILFACEVIWFRIKKRGCCLRVSR